MLARKCERPRHVSSPQEHDPLKTKRKPEIMRRVIGKQAHSLEMNGELCVQKVASHSVTLPLINRVRSQSHLASLVTTQAFCALD